MATKTMRAARRHGNRRVTVEDRPIPQPGPGEVLIQMRAAGICGSDLHGYREAEPPAAVLNFIPGHEPCGVVAERGAGVDGWSEGDRVVVYHRYTCRRCKYCLAGYRNLCPHRDPNGRRAYGANPDGADAEYMVAHAADLLPLAPAFDFLEGAVLACQAGTAYYGLRIADVRANDRLLVTGLGPVGLLCVLFAHAMAVDVIGVDPSPERRALAQALGLQQALDPTESALTEQVLAQWPEGATAWAETSGAAAVHATIPDAAAIDARVSIIGLGRSAPSLSLTRLMPKQIRVQALNLWPMTGWDEIADRAAAGKVVFRFG